MYRRKGRRMLGRRVTRPNTVLCRLPKIVPISFERDTSERLIPLIHCPPRNQPQKYGQSRANLFTRPKRIRIRRPALHLSGLRVDGYCGISTASLAIIGNVDQYTGFCCPDWKGISVQGCTARGRQFDLDTS
jgi:hypothetical protein